MQRIVTTEQLILIIKIIKNSEVSVLVLLLLSISITYETLKIKFLLKTRFRPALLSYFRSVVLGERGLKKEKIWWLGKSSLLLENIMETD